MNLQITPINAGLGAKSKYSKLLPQHKNVDKSYVSFGQVSSKLAEELKPFSTFEGLLGVFKLNPKLSQHFYKNGIPPMISKATYEDLAGGHSKRVSEYAVGIYRHLPKKYQKMLNVDELLYAGINHDIGKLGVPDEILNNPGALSPEDWIINKQHPGFGAELLETGGLGRTTSEGKNIIKYAKWHHQNLQGTEYPKQEGNYPLGAQIMKAADVYDAISSKRVYHEATPKDETLAIINDSLVKSKKLDSVIYKALVDSVNCDEKTLNAADSQRKVFYRKFINALRSIFFKRNQISTLDLAG